MFSLIFANYARFAACPARWFRYGSFGPKRRNPTNSIILPVKASTRGGLHGEASHLLRHRECVPQAHGQARRAPVTHGRDGVLGYARLWSRRCSAAAMRRAGASRMRRHKYSRICEPEFHSSAEKALSFGPGAWRHGGSLRSRSAYLRANMIIAAVVCKTDSRSIARISMLNEQPALGRPEALVHGRSGEPTSQARPNARARSNR